MSNSVKEKRDQAIEERVYSEAEIKTMNKKNASKRRISALLHLVLTLVALIGCYLWTEDIILTVPAYLLGYLVIKLIFSLLPEMGTFEGGYVDVYIGNGQYLRRWDEKATTHYGFFNVVIDVGVQVLGFILVAVLVYMILPDFMFYFILLGGAGIAMIKYLLLPIIADVTNIIAKSNKFQLFDNISVLVLPIGAILTVVAIIGAYFVLPNILPQKLNAIEALDEYSEMVNESNNFKGMNSNELDIEFKHASTSAELNYEGQFDCGNGIIKTGKSTVEFTYNLERWKVKNTSYEFEGILKVTSPVTFICDDEGFSMENFEAPALVKIRIDYFDGTLGKGNYEVIEKSNGRVVFTTPLTIEPLYDDSLRFILETPIDVGYFGYGDFECKYDIYRDTFELKDFGEKFEVEK